MEQPKDDDEEIVCTSCGVTFVFPAAAAAARAKRGNTTKPTMCRSCWQAKASTQERRGADAQGRSPARNNRGPNRPSQPAGWNYRSTGDVNEYRSPMPDPHYSGGSPAQPAARGWGRAATPGRRPPWNDGNYRAPSFQNEQRGGRRPHRDSNATGRNNDGRSRVSTEITCASCGASATVPFKPAEGQKVFCRTCYQTAKPT